MEALCLCDITAQHAVCNSRLSTSTIFLDYVGLRFQTPVFVSCHCLSDIGSVVTTLGHAPRNVGTF